MQLLHRLTCLLRGHISYERINVPDIPKPPTGTLTAGSIGITMPSGALSVAVADAAGNMSWSPVTQHNSISFDAGPCM